ncbi:MOSC domain-containing protein [Ruegeria marina]|uniref:MOSC domain-containing protein n=1 Tax=Ruegeria marina TaxID=639004 RepID=A0A1G6YDX1_9RHOB|nr:MOSC domain-containing protein [Ruegeria marina]SDD87785.1 hypothetical protein SAMN04488239_11197 [Ruegeria marina]
MRIKSIYRYPVKGLSPEGLRQVMLEPHEVLAYDRRYGLARPDCQFDPDIPQYLPKTQFYMLMREEKLAELRTKFDPEEDRLEIWREGLLLEAGVLHDPEERERLERFISGFLSDTGMVELRIVGGKGHALTNASEKPGSTTYKYVSLMNLATIGALERAMGMTLDPIRFRSNFYIQDMPEWVEFDWVGKLLQIGDARLKVVARTVRCAATMVKPATGERDLNVPVALKKNFGHLDLGVYAEVLEGGEVTEGASVTVIA